MNRQIIFTVAAGALLIAITGWVAYPAAPKKAAEDPSKHRFMHCPECKRETIYSIAGPNQVCPRCDKKYVATAQSIKSATPAHNRFKPMVALILVELYAVAGAILVITRRRSQAEDEFYYFNCGKCRQRIRYREKQIGLGAMCRRCRQPFRYPEISRL